MKILVTVGTTRFDSLITAVETSQFLQSHEVTVQCANGQKSKNFDCTEFIEDIDAAYQQADLIITHAGAGSVFRLLEAGQRILVVPNLEREDDHQKELAQFVDDSQYGLVCYDLARLDETLHRAATFSAEPYKKTEFHAAQEIVEWIKELD